MEQTNTIGLSAGSVWILFLNPDGTVKRHQEITTGKGKFQGLLKDGGRFGNSLANLDDIDGDGVIGGFHCAKRAA